MLQPAIGTNWQLFDAGKMFGPHEELLLGLTSKEAELHL